MDDLCKGFTGRLKKKVLIPGVGTRYICYVGTPDVPNDADPKVRTEAARIGFLELGEEKL
jgi:hypothetical protein